MFWFQDLIVFHILNKQTKKPAEIAKNTVLENLSYLRRSKRKLGGDIRMSTRNSLVSLFCLYYYLFTFRKHKQRKNTLWIIWPSVGQSF
jgi:hypothetical protein